MLKKELLKKAFAKRNIDIFFVAIAILIGIYFKWMLPQTLIFGIFIWVILNPVSSRITAIPALVFISVTPIVLIFKGSALVLFITPFFVALNGNAPDGNALAEEVAIYAYYFLIMSVIMAIYEVRKEEYNHEA